MDLAGKVSQIDIILTVDRTKPVIMKTLPNGTISFRPDMIEVIFSEDMDPSSIKISGIGDDSLVENSGATTEIFPGSLPEFGTTFSFTVSGRDLQGNSMQPWEVKIIVTDQVILTGWIRDEKNKGLSGAKIILQDGKFTYTNEDGSYSITTKMGNITIYAYKNGYKTASTDIFARPDRDNAVGVIDLEKDERSFVSSVSSFFSNPFNIIITGFLLLLLMSVSFLFWRYRDREKIVEVDIEMDDDDL
jgi:hypothetical protein